MAFMENIEDRLAISYYKDIASVNPKHGVSLVQHNQNGRICVKKVLQRYNPEVYRLVQSADIKGIPKIYNIYEENETHTLTIIEEYVSGETLDDLIKKEGALPDRKIIDITSKLCDILTSLHGLTPPVIHRDIKPSNIIITSTGEIYLVDLNAAKVEDVSKSEDTELLGTYGYAAPEQYGFGASRIQTDIYAVGMLINTMVQGSYSKEIPKGSKFSNIIKKCTMLRSEDRYEDARSLQAALLSHKEADRPSFLPPGFRTKNPMHMLAAVVGYAAIFSLSLTFETNNQISPIITWYERIFCLLIMLALVFFSADYGNIQRKFPLCKSSNLFIRIVGIILFDAIIATLIFFAMILGESLIIGLV